MAAPVIGILSLQGCVEPHAEHLRALGCEVRYVRQAKDLTGIQGLILPGGESTTMLKLAKKFGLWDELKKLSGKIPFWGICAGAILMAKEVENPSQESLAVMDLKVRRNAYGRQVDSFQQDIQLESGTEPAVFIRAPKFLSWSGAVKELGKVKGEAVFLESGRHMVTAFHPELGSSGWCHRRFLEKVGNAI
ncbi:MAG TPA: pyridoxal 5'-phosphate synthase glutaminase subunit PdxT [Bdellovibrionota bacterium]|jgi:5'-phosphate synthase pdxT subunit